MMWKQDRTTLSSFPAKGLLAGSGILSSSECWASGNARGRVTVAYIRSSLHWLQSIFTSVILADLHTAMSNIWWGQGLSARLEAAGFTWLEVVTWNQFFQYVPSVVLFLPHHAISTSHPPLFKSPTLDLPWCRNCHPWSAILSANISWGVPHQDENASRRIITLMALSAKEDDSI